MRSRSLGLLAALLTVLPPVHPLAAGEVTLRVKGGGLEVTGEIKSFDGTTYVIEAPSVGTMTFDASRFECVGDDCTRRISLAALPPEKLDPATPSALAINGLAPLSETLVPALIRGYAASLGAGVEHVGGSGTGAASYEIANAEGARLASLTVDPGTSSTAFTALDQGKAAIGITDRPITDAEAQALARLAPDMRSPETQHLIGHDGIAVVVSPDAAITAITEDHLSKIFSGQIRAWSDAGLPGGEITVYTAGPSSSAAEVFANALLKPRNLTLASTVKLLASETDVADAVARDANGIGIVSMALTRSAKRLNLVGTCGLITRPSIFAVKAGEYPLSRPLYLYTGGFLKEPAGRGLVRYALSREAQDKIAGLEYAGDDIDMLPVEDQTERMAFALNAPAQGFDMGEMKKLLADVKDAQRLSLTFRFVAGTFDLDARSKLDILRLADHLQTPELAGKQVMLFGFTDLDGRFSANESVSARRAAQVRSAVLTAANGKIPPSAIVAKGYGPLAPVACDDTPERRQLNRRVEVWVKTR